MDYQNKIWGGSQVRLNLNYLAYHRLKNALEAFKNLPNKSRVLEIGCGGGGFIASVKHYRSDLECIGVDISKKAIFYAKSKFPRVKYAIGDINSLSFPKKSFDAVLIEDVLEHLDTPEAALEEINRVLKPGGIFHLYVPLEGEKYTLHNLFNKLGFNFKENLAGHVQEYRFRDINKLLTKNKFNIKKHKFDVFIFGQLVDLGFFSFLTIFNKKLESGLEVDLDNKPALKFLKNIITVLVNIESAIFSSFTGAGVHITSIKK